MSDAERVLEQLGAPAHVELVDERLELLRFGGSRVTYQHSEERLTLRARLIRDGRSVWGTLATTEPEAVRALRERLERLAASLPPGDPPPLAAPGEPRAAVTAHASTEEADAADRIALLRDAQAAAPRGATLGGSILHAVATHAVANTEGVRAEERRTRAAMQLVSTLDGDSSWGRVVSRDAGECRVPELDGHRLPQRELVPGRYRAVLSPQAVVTLLATLGQVAFADAGQGTFADRVGEQLLSPLVSIADDGCDPAGLPSSFDCEGVPKQRVQLVEDGVVRGVVTRGTGHAVPPAWRFGGGPAASHLSLEPGRANDADLLAACGSGLYLQRVDYVRVVQPKRTLVTGSSRDGTFRVGSGRIVARVPQFRFTLRLDELFRDVLALGARRERGETVFMESVVAPGLTVDGFPVDLIMS
jgi:predicted Zn-dependent protease